MQYVRTSLLQPGMRLARPIYNRRGVLLYERNTLLTASGIRNIDQFGLWGIYILEPAEPVPPLSHEDAELERFLTMATFLLKEDMDLLLNQKTPKNLRTLCLQILKTFSSLDHKISLTRTLRSSDDYIYKHSLSTAILAAMMVQKLHYSYQEQASIVCAALLHDLGLLLVPEEILEKGGSLLSPDERRLIRGYLEKGYQLLHPDYNEYQLPDLTLQLVAQLVRLEHNVKIPLAQTVQFSNGTHVLHTAGMFDELTSMSLDREPVSELAAVRFLQKHPAYYPAPFTSALMKSVHILPAGCCLDFSNGQKGIILVENQKDFSRPVALLFHNGQRVDCSDPKFQNALAIEDVMKTMDLRIPVDAQTLKKYVSDPHTQEMAKRFFR